MTKIKWDQNGERRYETGVSHGVLYPVANDGTYPEGFGWNGLTAVTESPSGAESNKQYANNRVYLNLVSAEEFGGTIEAFTWPDEFGQCDGTAEPVPGVYIGQQNRRGFGLAWQTLVGNDTEGTDYGYKIKLVYGGLAAPTEKANATVNESPEATAFSWELTTTPVDVPGVHPITGKPFRPTSILTIDSTKFLPAKLKELEDILYGTESTDARLPLPEEVFEILEGAVATEVEPQKPTYNATTKVITIPTQVGVDYFIDGVKKIGTVTITADTLVVARAAAGYKFPLVNDPDWLYEF